MKKNSILIFKLFFGLLILIQTTNLQASHIMGGNLTYTCVGPNQYQVQMKLYQDCNGSNLLSQVSEPIVISSQSCNITLNLDIDFVNNPFNPNPEDVTPLCPGQATACNGGSGPYGIEKFTYIETFTLPANCVDWVISWDDCCRNSAITTLNGGGQSLYIETTLNNLNAPCNNSPNFLNDPTPFVCVGENVNYSHGVSELDGDSLAFSLINCLDDVNTSVSYGGGFSGINPLTTSTGVSINPLTGAINFTPTAVEVGVLCVLVQEYRNGQLIGEVMRDIQFRVLQCTNTLPVASGANGTVNSTGITGLYDLTYCEGEAISFDVTGFDGNAGDIINMGWNFGIPQGTFTVNNSVQPPVGTFTWNTTKADAGFHIFTVNMTDDACPIIGVNVFTFSITILDVPDVDPGNYQSMCNPTDTVTLAVNIDAADQSYAWTPVVGLVDPTAAITLANPSLTTTYTITKTFTNGCVEADSVTVEVLSDINIPTISDTSICFGDSIQLNAGTPITPNPQTFTDNTSQSIPDLDTLLVPIMVSGVSPANILNVPSPEDSTTDTHRVCTISRGLNDGHTQSKYPLQRTQRRTHTEYVPSPEDSTTDTRRVCTISRGLNDGHTRSMYRLQRTQRDGHTQSMYHLQRTQRRTHTKHISSPEDSTKDTHRVCTISRGLQDATDTHRVCTISRGLNAAKDTHRVCTISRGLNDGHT